MTPLGFFFFELSGLPAPDYRLLLLSLPKSQLQSKSKAPSRKSKSQLQNKSQLQSKSKTPSCLLLILSATMTTRLATIAMETIGCKRKGVRKKSRWKSLMLKMSRGIY